MPEDRRTNQTPMKHQTSAPTEKTASSDEPGPARRRLADFIADRRGAAAMIFATAALAFALAAGVGAEYAFREVNEARLRGAADAAALQAVNDARKAMIDAKVDPLSRASADVAKRQAILDQAQAKMEKVFAGFAADDRSVYRDAIRIAPCVRLDTLDPSGAQTARSGSGCPASAGGGSTACAGVVGGGNSNINACVMLRADISYSATSTSVLGAAELLYGGEAHARLQSPYYQTFVFILDTSGSMGIGATVQDQVNMVDFGVANPNSDGPCFFACHSGYLPAARSWVKSNKASNLLVRFDVVQQAMINMLERANRMQTFDGQYAFRFLSMRGFYDSVNRKYESLTEMTIPASSSVSATSTCVPTLSGVSKGVNYGGLMRGICALSFGYGTPWTYTMQKFIGQYLPAPSSAVTPSLVAQICSDPSKCLRQGSGLTPTDRKIAVGIITDGADDSRSSRASTDPAYPTYGPQPLGSGAMNPAFCEQIRANGIPVYVMNVKYVLPDVSSQAATPMKLQKLDAKNVQIAPGLSVGYQGMVMQYKRGVLDNGLLDAALMSCVGSDNQAARYIPVDNPNDPTQISAAAQKLLNAMVVEEPRLTAAP